MNQAIAAIATGPVSGPIGIVRISGPDTMAVIDRVFHPQDGKPLSEKPSRLLTYGSLCSRTGDVIEMSKAAEADGADGVMVVTPWYMGPNKEELYHHYKAIHDSIDISLMMYHNPYYSTVLLDDRFIAKMYNEGCIDAIKERQADVFRQQNLRRLTDENFAIFYGYDVCPVETQATWSDGWVVGTGNLFPKENSTIYKLAKKVQAGEATVAEAMKAQEELMWPYLPLFTEPDSNGDVLWLQMIKIGLKMRGVNAGYCRKPVINGLPQEDMDRLTAALKHYNYI